MMVMMRCCWGLWWLVTLLAILHNINKFMCVVIYKWLKKTLVIENTKSMVRNKKEEINIDGTGDGERRKRKKSCVWCLFM
jgi:hypothetical protein